MASPVTFTELIETNALEIGDGYRAKNSELGGDGPIFLRSAYLQDQGFVREMPERFSDRNIERFGPKIARLGDVVITTKGNSTGRIGVIRPDQVGAVYSPHLSYWRSRDLSRLDQHFLTFWSRSAEFQAQLAAMAYSTDMAPYLSLRDQKRLRISLPDIRHQRTIAEVLGSLDDKIELNRRMNETLEAMAQTIFRDWFVDFGPTSRKRDGASDPVEIMGGMVSDPDRARELAALFPARLSDDGLPEGWQEGDLSHYATLNPESLIARNAPAEVEYVDLANTKWGLIEATTRYAWVDAPSRARRAVRTGDTIVGTVRPGNGSYSFIGTDGLTASTGFAALRPRSTDMNALVYLAATSAKNIERLEMLADGGAYPAVRPDVVLATSVPTVPEPVVASFASLCSPIMELSEHNKIASRTLAATRDWLLPKLMSGEIRLRAAEVHPEAVQ